MNSIVDASQSSTRELQEQIDIYKEKNRRELSELQRLLRERGQELEQYLLATKALQDQVQWATSWVIGTNLNTDTTFSARMVKSRPSSVSPAEASHAERQMMSHCSDSNSLTPSPQHHPLLSERDVITLVFLLPAALSNPNHNIKVRSLSRVKPQEISVLYSNECLYSKLELKWKCWEIPL